MISKSAEDALRVNTPESLQTMETMEVSLLVHLQGSDCLHTSFWEQTPLGSQGWRTMSPDHCSGRLTSVCHSVTVHPGQDSGPYFMKSDLQEHISSPVLALFLSIASWMLYSLRAWTSRSFSLSPTQLIVEKLQFYLSIPLMLETLNSGTNLVSQVFLLHGNPF